MLMCASAAAFAAVPAPPYTTNGDCTACHDVASAVPTVSRVAFDVPPTVSLEKCKACHRNLPDLIAYAGSYQPMHYHTGSDCVGCHNGDDAFRFVPGTPRLMVTMPVATSYGYFVAVQSLAAAPLDLHRIHSGAGWVQQVFGNAVTGPGDGSSYMASVPGVPCASCHAAAACGACHDVIPHGTHGSSTYVPVTIKQATGTSVTEAPSSCIVSACHSLAKAGTADFVPTCASCHPGNTGVHGYGAIDHVAADSSSEGVACSACHTLDLSAEHAKSTSSSSGLDCATCHPTPRDTLDAWNQTCVTGGCHSAGSGAPMHAAESAAHEIVSAGTLCLGCHAGSDLTSVHTAAHNAAGDASCLVCHSATSAPASNDCTVCHFTFSEHYDVTAHTGTWTTAGCSGTGCHPGTSLAEVHQPYLARYPQYADTCSLCHRNDDPTRVDWSVASAECGSCHTVHGDITVLHTAPSSTECVACHETADVRVIHGATPETSCATCHNATLDLTGKTTRCIDCHALSPVSTRHYPAAAHLAVTESGCTKCHSRDMMTEHLKSTVNVTCVQCHESKVDAFTAPWNHTCEACHPQKHGPSRGKSVPTR